MAMITKPVEVVTCPFDEAHVILKERLQFHLTKCAYANKIKKSQVVLCPFNSVHRVPQWELNHHINICEDRKKIETFVQSTVDTTPLFSVKKLEVTATENWDLVPGTTYRPSSVMYDKPVLLNLQGVTPSERKAFRAEERRRLKEYQEQAAAEKKQQDNNIVGYVRRPKGTPKAKELPAVAPLMQEFENLSVRTTDAGNSGDKNPFEDKDGFVVPRYSRRGRGRFCR